MYEVQIEFLSTDEMNEFIKIVRLFLIEQNEMILCAVLTDRDIELAVNGYNGIAFNLT